MVNADAPWLHLPAHLGMTVEVGPVPRSLDGAVLIEPWLGCTPNETLAHFPNGFGMHVSDGRTIVIDPAAGVDAGDDASWVVQGWGVAMAAMQSGLLTLHAAAVRLGDETVCIAGHQGAGKSTTAMALMNRGHQLLVDDLCLLTFDTGGKACVIPFARNVHLLPDAAAALGVDFDALPRLAGARAKAAFRPDSPPTAPQPIDRIVVLTPGADEEAVTTHSITGAARAAVLHLHANRQGIAPAVMGRARYFDLLTRLSASVPVVEIRRPRDDWSLDQVVEAIEAGS